MSSPGALLSARLPFHPRLPRSPAFASLVLVTGVGPLALDTYLPALPAMQRSLHTSAPMVQLTVTMYIVGLALGQLLAGPLSDGLGRRLPLLISTAGFTVMGVVCATAVDAQLLVGARLLHGLLAGAGVSVGRAVVSDGVQGQDAARKFGTLSSINLIAPVIAPSIGAVILGFGDWRTVFWFVTVLGAVMFVAVWIGVPETLPADQRHGSGVSATGRRMADLAGDWAFTQNVVVQCLATASFFTYIGGSAFVLETVYGIGQGRYATVFTVNAIAMICGSLTYRFLVHRLGPIWMRSVGLSFGMTATTGLIIVALLGTSRVPSLIVPWALLCVLTFGMGMIGPSSMTLAQAAGRRARGTASALQGGSAFLVGACVTPLTGLFGYHSLRPMATLMVSLMFCAFIAGFVSMKSSRRVAALESLAA
ncbi:multidrug effflux MFS transporter [Jatrophihabitans telluris]|uniref:Multidrug effflux MFS transporter n=1 Tax=Jatrophihabitans telluris TaxID=2038343 RepID=A0ABY4R2J9_9ACTN|nr:multidrug effflux MFS transporter [Jatrophihabitans telluris]UQX89496.1 multidrug effflux MFS transporter [Jatrophihabitans telluris]